MNFSASTSNAQFRSPTTIRSSRRMWQILVGLTLIGALAACGGGNKNIESPNPPSNPTAPGSLIATPASASRIDLTWQASTAATGATIASYSIYRNGGLTAIGTTTTTSFADTGLTASTQYSYTVLATDSAGRTSPASNSATATTNATPVVGGLDARPSNATCRAWNRGTATSSTSLSQVFAQVPAFSAPIAMLQAPANSSRWYVVEQGGRVYWFNNVSTANTRTEFINITDRVVYGGEMGLLGMAFHPNYPTDPRVFLSYTTANTSRISAFRMLSGGTALDPTSEQVVLTVDQPEGNHNGGNIAFGPDGYLYIGFGDGGGSNDQHGTIGNGQRLTTMLGKMLRIDVNVTGAAYGIPSSNPYSGNALCPAAGRDSGNCPEIYAYGLRNPWRWSFDRQNGDLWVGDVGQYNYEEVDRVTLGGNYGWRCREAAHNTAGISCSSYANMIDPVAEYGRSLGQSITGGYVYRGAQNTSLRGSFIFGDFATGNLFAYTPGSTSLAPQVLLGTGLNISSFAQDQDGELYVVHYSGSLHRINFGSSGGGTNVPNALVDTGCVNTSNATQPASGLIPYAVNSQLWSDGAAKDRYLALPDGQSINVQADHDWDFPNGSVLVKNFRIGNQLVETRLLMRHPDDGTWSGYTYEWNTAQTGATRVIGGATRTLTNNQTWVFPSEAECLQCHTTAAGRTIGPETAQLNRNFTYPQTGRTANQLTTLNAIQTLSPALTAAPTALPSMPDPADTSADLGARARAYLHANCSHCHRPGTGIVQMDLRYTTALAATATCNVLPQGGDVGLGANARLIVPGNATNSILLNRMNRRDTFGMPLVGTAMVDANGVALITQWINSLTGC